MEIRTNRIYPYPVLSELSDDFIDNTFHVERNLEYDLEKATINLKTTIADVMMLRLIDNSKVSLNCSVECSTTKYRELFEIPSDKMADYSIEIPLSSLNDNVEIMCVLVAKEEIIFDSDNLNELYKNELITYPKYSTIGYTDTEVVRVIKSMDTNGDVPSIFLISMTEEDNKISYNPNGDQIIIYLPKNEHKIYYDAQGKYKRLKQLMVNVAVLVAVLDEIKGSSEAYEDYGWYKVLEEKFCSLGYDSLTSDNFKSEQSVILAQIVLGNISEEGFKDFAVLKSGQDGDQE